jgi:hypothetical protein
MATASHVTRNCTPLQHRVTTPIPGTVARAAADEGQVFSDSTTTTSTSSPATPMPPDALHKISLPPPAHSSTSLGNMFTGTPVRPRKDPSFALKKCHALTEAIRHRQPQTIRGKPQAIGCMELITSDHAHCRPCRFTAAAAALVHAHRVYAHRVVVMFHPLPRADSRQRGFGRHAPWARDASGWSHVSHVRSMNHVNDVNGAIAGVGDQQAAAICECHVGSPSLPKKSYQT